MTLKLRETFAYKFLRGSYWAVKKAYWKTVVYFSKAELRKFKLHDGSTIYYPINTEVGRQLLLGDFEIPEVSFLKSTVKKGDVFMDIGANAGIYSVLASNWVGEKGHVYAFEIGPKEIDLFNLNIKANNLTNISLLTYAVSNSKGTAKFAISRDGAMNSLAQNNHPHQRIEEWIEVKTTTLSEASKEFDIDRVDVIKMDVEGAEKLVFEGGIEQLKKWKPRIILFECSSLVTTAFGYSVLELIQYLQEKGLFVYSFSSRGVLRLIDSDYKIKAEYYNFVATFDANVLEGDSI